MSKVAFFPARPTTYRGIRMRSRLEAEYAASLDEWVAQSPDQFASDPPWKYEPMCFASGPVQYLPDFSYDMYVGPWPEPDRWYIEVKPVVDDWESVARRMEVIWDSEPQATLMIDEMRGQMRTWSAHGDDREWWCTTEVGTDRVGVLA